MFYYLLSSINEAQHTNVENTFEEANPTIFIRHNISQQTIDIEGVVYSLDSKLRNENYCKTNFGAHATQVIMDAIDSLKRQ